MAMKIDKRAIRNTEIWKNKPKKQANFNQNKPKNKQPASHQKKPQIHKKQAQIRGKTARLATLLAAAAENTLTMAHRRNSQHVPQAKQERTTDSQKRGIHAARPNVKECWENKVTCECTRKADKAGAAATSVASRSALVTCTPSAVTACDKCYVAGAKFVLCCWCTA